MAARVANTRRPDKALLNALEKVQRQISSTDDAYERRRELVVKIWTDGMMTQLELSEFLSGVADRAGGQAVTQNAVHKMIAKAR